MVLEVVGRVDTMREESDTRVDKELEEVDRGWGRELERLGGFLYSVTPHLGWKYDHQDGVVISANSRQLCGIQPPRTRRHPWSPR